MNDTADRFEVARDAARAGAEVAQGYFRKRVDVETKDGKSDVVTRADREAQQRVIEVIEESYPDDAVVGEEDDALRDVPDDGPVWVVDPIDGTLNYVHGIRHWTTSVAAVVDGDPVAAASVLPALGDEYLADETSASLNGTDLQVSDVTDPETALVTPLIWWDLDQREEYADVAREIVTRFADMRRLGCAQYELALLAAGSLDGTFTNLPAYPWDTIAGVHMVRQAGGTVTDLDGEPWTHDADSLVASNGRIHDEVLDAAQTVAAEWN